jgi:hypothetical protein
MTNSAQKEFSIEYAHIYTNNKIGEEHKLSLDILGELYKERDGDGQNSLVVMVDDYSFPDPSFNYEEFTVWLTEKGFKPDLMIRESQLIPLCDEVLKLVTDNKLKEQISDYVRAKKYPCSLFVATWYFLRLGYVSSPLFDPALVAKKLINILPLSFKPFEDKALEIIASTKFSDSVAQIEHTYFEGRLVA